MEVTFVGLGFDATLMLPILERNIPARYLAVSSETIDLEAYQVDKISFRMHPSIELPPCGSYPKLKKEQRRQKSFFCFPRSLEKSKRILFVILRKVSIISRSST